MSGQKIIDGLREAIAGKLDRVLINGEVWVKLETDHVVVHKDRLSRLTNAVGNEFPNGYDG